MENLRLGFDVLGLGFGVVGLGSKVSILGFDVLKLVLEDFRPRGPKGSLAPQGPQKAPWPPKGPEGPLGPQGARRAPWLPRGPKGPVGPWALGGGWGVGILLCHWGPDTRICPW